MKLIYQWIIVLSLSVLLWAIHTYGGSACSKPVPTSKATFPALKIVVQRRPSLVCETSERPQEDTVPTIPPTPPSKTASQRRKERRKASKFKREVARDSDDWDFCVDRPLQMIQ